MTKRTGFNKVYLLTILLFFPISLVIWFASLFIPVISGIAAFPLKSIQCGHQPVVAGGFAGQRLYTEPGDNLYRGPDIFTKPEDLYCTNTEAETAGYSLNTWSERCESAAGQSESSRCKHDGDGLDATFNFFTFLVVIAGISSYVISLRIDNISRRRNKLKSKK